MTNFFYNFITKKKLNFTIIFLTSLLVNQHKILAKNSAPAINKTLPQITITATNNTESYNDYETSSALRISKKLLDTPQSINIINSQQIRDQNIVNFQEASRYIPSLYVKQGESNRDQISIRGNDSTADFFIDGARDDMQYFRDFYNIEQIEVLNGPNALSFGRGGAGGVINRASKFAKGNKIKRFNISGGSFDNRRLENDFSDKITKNFFFRNNALYEKSKTFRDYGNMEKFGVNPTFTYILNPQTDIKFGYEYFYDQRFNDRGLPSKNGAPLQIRSSKFIGNPNENTAQTALNSYFFMINHDFNEKYKIRNYTRLTNYDKYYKNVFASSALDNNNNFKISAYDNDQNRQNFTNQTDLIFKFNFNNIKHEILLGSEITNQQSSLARKDGKFNNSTTQTISIFDDINSTPINYNLSIANKSSLRVLAGYLQDNIIFNKNFEANIGIRFDNYNINFRDKLLAKKYNHSENLVSPKIALIYKPTKNFANYISYSTSYLPSSGDQFNDINDKNFNLKSEKIQNYEIGTKINLSEKFSVNSALFILERTNTKANDPNGSGFYILSGSSRVKGFEFAANGTINNKNNIIASFSHLNAQITSATTNANKGQKLALTAQNKLSIWHKYNFNENFAGALGFVSQSGQFAAIDNNVRIKGFKRFDAALFYKANQSLRYQINVENIFNHQYYISAHNNNNIQPGSPRAFKINLVADL